MPEYRAGRQAIVDLDFIRPPMAPMAAVHPVAPGELQHGDIAGMKAAGAPVGIIAGAPSDYGRQTENPRHAFLVAVVDRRRLAGSLVRRLIAIHRVTLQATVDNAVFRREQSIGALERECNKQFHTIVLTWFY